MRCNNIERSGVLHIFAHFYSVTHYNNGNVKEEKPHFDFIIVFKFYKEIKYD